MQTKHLRHKHGGRILAIHAVAHNTYKSVADWYFIGDIEFSDKPGVVVGNREIPPYAVCYDHENPEAKAEGDAVFKELNEHLLSKGVWHDPKHMKDGRVVNWTPKEKTGLSPL